MSSLRVASWNIRKCVGLDWRRDPHRTARVLGELTADVVALQEVDKRLGQRPAALPRHLIHAETAYDVVDVDGHEASIGWHGNALLVSRDVGIETAHAIRLPGLEPRGALILDLSRGGAAWRVVAVHLGLLRRSRLAQLTSIREQLLRLEPRPTVVMGDFNEWSPARGLEGLAGFEVHAPGLTFHASRPVAALDRFALSSELRLKTARVVETSLTRVASDHLPIEGEVEARR